MSFHSTGPRTAGIWLAALMLACVGCDQFTKHLAVRSLADQPALSFWQDTFRLQFALNSGGFLGLGGDWSPAVRMAFFIGLNGIGLTALAVYLLRNLRRNSAIAFACTLILAGGIGNQIDRCLLGGVVIDFMNIGIGPLRSGIFNVADMAITGGSLWWMALISQVSSDEPLTIATESHSLSNPRA